MKCLIVLTLAYISIGCAGKNPDLCQIQTPGSTAYVHSFNDVHPNDFGHATLAKAFLSVYQGAQ